MNHFTEKPIYLAPIVKEGRKYLVGQIYSRFTHEINWSDCKVNSKLDGKIEGQETVLGMGQPMKDLSTDSSFIVWGLE